MSLPEMYGKLYSEMGDLGWWPGETSEEVLIGAILTQNTSWTNVEKALAHLREEGCLSLECIATMEKERLSEVIRSAGFHNQKAERLIDLSSLIISRYGSLEEMASESPEELSEFLISRRGIGEETRDAILLYALNKRAFVVDKYTHRIFVRTGIISDESGMPEAKESIEKDDGYTLDMLKNFHGMIVRLAKEHCRKKPICSGCPLSGSCRYYTETMLP